MKNASLCELSKKLASQEITSLELAEFSLHRIAETEKKLNAYITINEKLMDQAKASDERIKAGKARGPLEGIPMGIKDLFCTQGLLTTAGSKILANFIPPYTATAVEKLQSAGALVLGKNNMDEFAMGSSNETSFFGACRNPWNLDCVPGGSSGGSASSVAAGQVCASLGSDTGGSVRQPASFCNLVGAKPTYGRVSRWGMIAYASSMDQAGVLTRKVEDAALLLEIICGHDSKDSTSSQKTVPKFSNCLKQEIKGRTFGVIKNFLSAEIDSEIRAAFEESLAEIKKAGAKIVEIEIPHIEMSVATYYLVATSEASSNLSRYDGVRFGFRADFSKDSPDNIEDFYSRTRGQGFGEEVKRRILLGTFSLSSGYFDEYYLKAGRVRHLIKNSFDAAFKKCEALISPVTTGAAFRVGEKIKDPIAMYNNDVFTTSANLAGLPAMSVPLGFTKTNMPFGLQIMADQFAEENMLRLGAWVENYSRAFERQADVI